MSPRDVEISPWALACIAVLVFGTATLNWSYHTRVIDKIDLIHDQEERVLTTKWTSGGKERSWTSTLGQYDENETIKQLVARHKTELVEAMEDLPEDPTPGETQVPGIDD